MHRVNVHLTENQRDKLKEIKVESGLKVAEIIRRAIDEYLKRERGDVQDAA